MVRYGQRRRRRAAPLRPPGRGRGHPRPRASRGVEGSWVVCTRIGVRVPQGGEGQLDVAVVQRPLPPRGLHLGWLRMVAR